MNPNLRRDLLMIYFGLLACLIWEAGKDVLKMNPPPAPTLAEHLGLAGEVRALRRELRHLRVDLGIPQSPPERAA